MKYKEFVKWCNVRARDGRWGIGTAIHCINIVKQIQHLPFWKREKEWQKIKGNIERDVVIPIEEKIKAVG